MRGSSGKHSFLLPSAQQRKEQRDPWPGTGVAKLPQSHLSRGPLQAVLQQVKAPASMDLGRIFPRRWLEGSWGLMTPRQPAVGLDGMHCVLTRAKAWVSALERQFPSSRPIPLSQKWRWEGIKAAGEQTHVWAFPWGTSPALQALVVTQTCNRW